MADRRRATRPSRNVARMERTANGPELAKVPAKAIAKAKLVMTDELLSAGKDTKH